MSFRTQNSEPFDWSGIVEVVARLETSIETRSWRYFVSSYDEDIVERPDGKAVYEYSVSARRQTDDESDGRWLLYAPPQDG